MDEDQGRETRGGGGGRVSGAGAQASAVHSARQHPGGTEE